MRWSDAEDAWVFEDSIRVKVGTVHCICHSECFHTLDEFEKSSDDNMGVKADGKF